MAIEPDEPIDDKDYDDDTAPVLLDFTSQKTYFIYRVLHIKWIEGERRKIWGRVQDMPKRKKPKSWLGIPKHISKTLIAEKGCLVQFPKGSLSPDLDIYWLVSPLTIFEKGEANDPMSRLLKSQLRQGQLDKMERETLIEDMMVSQEMSMSSPSLARSQADNIVSQAKEIVSSMKEIENRPIQEPERIERKPEDDR